MPGLELIQTLLQQATGRASKSTALQPLGWALVILVGGFIGALGYHAPVWCLVVLASLACITVSGYLGAYAFCMVKNPDALRSETFTLSKMQIERSRIGDSEHGFSSSPQLSGTPTEVIPIAPMRENDSEQ